jgi:hypothetical protein
MPVFRGNAGNLLQHWVFCEILEALHSSADHIDFIDAYSMAPLADERAKLDTSAYLFDCVQGRLSGAQTAYERAWYELAPEAWGYPNSAAFLVQLWPGRYSLLLCESEPATVEQLRRWVAGVERSEKCIHALIAPNDWRRRFMKPLTSSGDLTLISFDPYMFDQRGPGQNPGNMVLSDLYLLNKAIEPITGSLVVQLSTYSANNGNRQADVIEVVTSGLSGSELELIATVRVDGNMMSLLFGRNLVPPAALTTLSDRFANWLAGVKATCAAGPSMLSTKRAQR